MTHDRVPLPIRPLAATLLPLLAAGCGGADEGADGAAGEGAALKVKVVLDGLNNPAGVSFSPEGRLTVCAAGSASEAGNGRVITAGLDGKDRRNHLTGFPTQYWKPGSEGEPDRFKLGPLGAAWLADGRLVVSNSGLADGVDHLRVYESAGDAEDGVASNAIEPTSDDPADNGEGNFTGLSVGADGTVFVAGQGADAKTWVLTFDPEEARLETFASADEHGIGINSPMATLPEDGESLLVLYSGAGGVEDGLIVRWSLESGEPLARWTLPGLVDPMGMARFPGGTDLAVVDNNWDLREVRDGRLARVALPEGGGEAEVTVLHEGLKGPTACAFGPDRRLYVAQLGAAFDADRGNVVAISGF